VCVLLALMASVGSHAMPQYAPLPQQSRNPSEPNAAVATGGDGVVAVSAASGISQQQVDLPKGCRLVDKDIQIIVEVEREDVVCTPYKERQCDKKYRQVCNPYETETCNTIYKKVCETKYKEVCEELTREVPEEYVEDMCDDVLTKVCDSKWVVQANGDKVWQEDPTTCREIPETKCSPVKKTRTYKQSYTDCNDYPYDDCKDVPEEVCNKEQHDGCEQVEYEDCYDVDREKCENVHTKTPQSQTETRQVRVCDGSNEVVLLEVAADGGIQKTTLPAAAAGVHDNKSKGSNDPRRAGIDADHQESVFLFST